MPNAFPAKLLTYFFTKQLIEPNPLFDVKKAQSMKNAVSAFIRKNEAGDQYYCTVNVDLDEEKSENFPYIYSIEAFGAFGLNNKEKEKLFSGVVRTQGTSLLLGAIREKIASETAMGPWSKCIMDFFPLDEVEFYVPNPNYEEPTSEEALKQKAARNPRSSSSKKPKEPKKK